MNLLDLFILLWLAQYVIRGFLGGLVRLALELGGLLVALYVAGVFYDQLADLLTPVFLNSRNWAGLISFLILYLMVYELFAYAIRWLDQARGDGQRLPFAQGIRSIAGGRNRADRRWYCGTGEGQPGDWSGDGDPGAFSHNRVAGDFDPDIAACPATHGIRISVATLPANGDHRLAW
ncbi:MAG: CvpA family protein [Anaerolineae bacterium]|uniref:CvpA family protein n=1 Tax=Candidatus Amarolinea dominans TaxID=3140696 RepID=UPI0031357D64|nr:CvpA family protein [Anaerolineae bacterium]